MSCGVGLRRGWNPALLCCRPAATAPFGPLFWGPPYAAGCGPKKEEKEKKKKKAGKCQRVINFTREQDWEGLLKAVVFSSQKMLHYLKEDFPEAAQSSFSRCTECYSFLEPFL